MHKDLPIEHLQDLDKRNENTWNIVKVGFNRNNANQKIVTHRGSRAMTVFYPKNSLTPTSVPERPLGGLGFYAAPKEVFPANDVTFKYSVFFEQSFNPQKGGKLPGIFVSPSGAENFCGASGGNKTSLSASCRIMWRQDLKAEAYVYTSCKQCAQYSQIPCSVMNPAYGDSLWRGILHFEKEKWNTVSITVRMNAIGSNNGLLTVKINENSCTFGNMTWRTNPSVCVSSILVDTFFGGSTPDYACPQDSKVHFKDFSVTRN